MKHKVKPAAQLLNSAAQPLDPAAQPLDPAAQPPNPPLQLPYDDDALVTGAVVDTVFGGQSKVTRWRRVKAGVIPPPIKLPGSHICYWRTGTIRAALAKHFKQAS